MLWRSDICETVLKKCWWEVSHSRVWKKFLESFGKELWRSGVSATVLKRSWRELCRSGVWDAVLDRFCGQMWGNVVWGATCWKVLKWAVTHEVPRSTFFSDFGGAVKQNILRNSVLNSFGESCEAVGSEKELLERFWCAVTQRVWEAVFGKILEETLKQWDLRTGFE